MKKHDEHIRICRNTKDAMSNIQEIIFHTEEGLEEYSYERLGAIVSSIKFERENLLKQIQAGVDNDEHEDDTSMHLKGSFD